MKFCESVNTCRTAFLVFPAGHIVFFLAEHIVSRNVQEQSFPLCHHNRQILRCVGIEPFRKVPVALGCVHIGVGGAIDDDIYSVVIHHFAHSLPVRYVQMDRFHSRDIHHIRKYVLVAAPLCEQPHFIAQLSVGSCYKYVHKSQISALGCVFFNSSITRSRYCP